MTQNIIAFEGTRRVAAGPLPEVIVAAKPVVDRAGAGQVLLFDAITSQPVEVDFRGSLSEVLARVEPKPDPEPRGPGRPKLGVVAREVTLLPRHWEWLAEQPGGASVALRKLVETARKESGDADRKRAATESAYRFMIAVGGNLPEFEEATRALFSGDRRWFAQSTARWPADVRDHVVALAFQDLEAAS
jgi:hypothetical protein